MECVLCSLVTLLFYKAKLSVLKNFELVQVASVRFTEVHGVDFRQLLLLSEQK